MKNIKHLLSTLLALLCLSAFLIIEVNALPAIPSYRSGPPREGTLPPEIILHSLTNNSHYNTVVLSFNASVGNSTTAESKHIQTIYYKTNWRPTHLYNQPGYQPPINYLYDRVVGLPMPPIITEYSTSINFTNVPDGNHTITIYVKERGTYRDETGTFTQYFTVFEISNILTVNFVVDTVLPVVSILSPENMVYTSSNVTLNCTVNEKVSQLSYSLDDQELLPCPVLEKNTDKGFCVVGEPTLGNLSDGEHSVIFYATDEAGNVGVSETLYFIVDTPKPEPFPTTIVLGVVAIIVVAGLGILAYFKKRRS